jgi:peptidoglycan biosynthesis protein MviN/MurJ (putative lipid II flippase)
MEKQPTQAKKIDDEMRNLIEEARVILPGLQALFGFQTIAVFNDRFDELAAYAKVCHLLGLAMVIISVAMTMTPATYYRARNGNATPVMARISSLMIRGAMAPLAVGLSLDMFTVIDVATGILPISIGAGAATFVLLAYLWFILPRREGGRLGKLARKSPSSHSNELM